MKIVVDINYYKHRKKDQTPFFENLCFSIEDKGIYCLLGDSGVGKTTLMNILLGIGNGDLSGTTVNYYIDGGQHSIHELRNKGFVGYQPQDFCLIPWLNVKKNLLVPAKVNTSLINPTDNTIIEKMEEIGLNQDDLSKYPHELSFGMKARVSLVRALIYTPRILFIDELFTGVDFSNNELIGECLQRIAKDTDTVILSITHNIEKAIDISSDIYGMTKNHTLKRMPKPFDKTQILTILTTE
jgi:NitT/TauT family transport system ATP-binding protein